eukprot:Gb_26284 [translate_table: standard]
MGSNFEEILDNVCYPEILLSFLNGRQKRKKYLRSEENSILEFHEKLYCVGGDLVFSESLCKELQKKSLQQRCELGRIGNPNKKLNLDIPENEIFSLPQDVLAAANYSIRVKFGMGTLDDMDHLKNKRICSVADLLQNQFGLALGHLVNLVRRTIRRATKCKCLPTCKNLVTSTPLTTTFQDFFGLHPLSQILDQTNPLKKAVHRQKLSYLGPGGLTRRTASFWIRDIHPSNYGRICSIETFEGINAGLVASLAIHEKIGHCDSLRSAFHKISEGSKEEHMVYPSPGEDEYYRIAIGNSLALNQGIQEYSSSISIRIFSYCTGINSFLSIFPFQYFFVGVSLIPFLEHNDVNRALMGSNMQRQAIPLFQPKKCITRTRLEGQVAPDSGSVTIAIQEGRIEYTDAENITFLFNGDTIGIELVLYQHSNKNTCMHQKH